MSAWGRLRILGLPILQQFEQRLGSIRGSWIACLVLIISQWSPWQLHTAPGNAADGHIDLLTVLMHELGHVMGLGRVSSAVDNIRLMAGSIDPGIRRLPSSLDLDR